MRQKNQIYNPYLPSYEYIPDGEPHVFGDRVYVYGSHDRFNGAQFCLNDYVCYSASIYDLTEWKYEGVIYRSVQDPVNQNISVEAPAKEPGFAAKAVYSQADLSLPGVGEMFAPDVVCGPDGRYYLFYCINGYLTASVAVSESPAGKYEYLGKIHYPDGILLGKKTGDYMQFDPGVFMDDDGQVYLYSGNAAMRPEWENGTCHSIVAKLENDMLTLAENPHKLLPSVTECEGTGYEGHEFFEASSIRKIGSTYYFVYSSINSHELCYATSDKPDEDYKYGGTIVDIGDVYLDDRTEAEAVNYFGNTHGGIELINGQWYVFYHRQSNQTQYSRQACAEKIYFDENGCIAQVEVTSQGMNSTSLKAQGSYPANICCHLTGKNGAKFSVPAALSEEDPYLTQDLADIEPGSECAKLEDEHPIQYIANVCDETRIGYKYFDFDNVNIISIRIRGNAKGKLSIYTDFSNCCGQQEFSVNSEDKWVSLDFAATPENGQHSLYLTFEGSGKFDFQEIKFAYY